MSAQLSSPTYLQAKGASIWWFGKLLRGTHQIRVATEGRRRAGSAGQNPNPLSIGDVPRSGWKAKRRHHHHHYHHQRRPRRPRKSRDDDDNSDDDDGVSTQYGPTYMTGSPHAGRRAPNHEWSDATMRSSSRHRPWGDRAPGWERAVAEITGAPRDGSVRSRRSRADSIRAGGRPPFDG